MSSAALRTVIETILDEIFSMLIAGLRTQFCVEAMQSLGMIVASSPASRVYVNTDLVDALFAGGGLTTDLVEILKVLMKHVSDVRGHIQV